MIKSRKSRFSDGLRGGVKIGDNVMLGAGSKILNGVTIGDNAKVGANCVVVQDIPADATCVLPKSRIIIKNEK
ncbi:MAG: DapH/DapD/GlmU-related protein [Prevotella sp.]